MARTPRDREAQAGGLAARLRVGLLILDEANVRGDLPAGERCR
jgi:hypothetical protein